VRLRIFIVLAVAAAGLTRDVSVYFWKAGPLHTARIDDRFAGLREHVPPGQRLQFMTDAPPDAAASRYFDALYALSPRLVELAAGPRLVIADLQDPAGLAAFCARWHLRVVAQGGPGVALLERE
jgi:hypothetical protein